MSKKEKDLIKSFLECKKEITSSVEKSQEFLIQTGICTSTGKLTKNYK